MSTATRFRSSGIAAAATAPAATGTMPPVVVASDAGIGAGTTASAPAHCACRRPVLYVEDHPLNAEVMQAVFSYLPAFRLVVVNDGASALMQAQIEPPALLLLDLGLPDGDGTELLARLRELPALAATPAIAVTARPPAELPSPGESGFVEIWGKPLRIARVLQGVERWAKVEAAVAMA